MEALQLCCQPSLRTDYLTQRMSPASPADASTQTQLDELGKLSVLEQLLTSEKRFLWKYRTHPDIKADPTMLLKFLDSVDWTGAEAVEETKRYLGGLCLHASACVHACVRSM